MNTMGNFLWIILGGGIFIFLCLTVIGIPFGVQCIKLSVLGLMPFGQQIHDTNNTYNFLSILMNVLWILIGGIELVVTHLVFALLCAITIIGIPFAKQHLKLAGLALTPFGKTIG